MKKTTALLLSISVLALTSSIQADVIKTDVIEIKSVKEHKDHVAAKKPVITMYTASWCGPCKSTKPHFKELAKDNKDFTFCMVDTDKFATSLASSIKGIPTFIVTYAGKTVTKETGGKSKKQLETLLNDSLKKIQNSKK